jgi:hypothetical protein
MTLTTIFREAVDAIKTAHPELAVAVVSGAASTTGTKATATGSAALADMGEGGSDIGSVRVSADAFAKPAAGATITVGGSACTVMGVDTDGVGAFWVISYQLQKPK